MDISSSGESPFVVATHTGETSATYGVSTRTKRVLLFRACDANSRIVNISRGPRIHDGAWRGDSKSERLRKRKSVAPHRPAKRPRLFKADQQETELRHSRTFRKWRHNFAVTTRQTCMVVTSVNSTARSDFTCEIVHAQMRSRREGLMAKESTF